MSNVIEKLNRKARMIGVRHHWTIAKSLAATMTEARVNDMLGRNATLTPIERIKALVLVRKWYLARHDAFSAKEVSAAIWNEVQVARSLKSLPMAAE